MDSVRENGTTGNDASRLSLSATAFADGYRRPNGCVELRWKKNVRRKLAETRQSIGYRATIFFRAREDPNLVVEIALCREFFRQRSAQKTGPTQLAVNPTPFVASPARGKKNLRWAKPRKLGPSHDGCPPAMTGSENRALKKRSNAPR